MEYPQRSGCQRSKRDSLAAILLDGANLSANRQDFFDKEHPQENSRAEYQ